MGLSGKMTVKKVLELLADINKAADLLEDTTRELTGFVGSDRRARDARFDLNTAKAKMLDAMHVMTADEEEDR